jgi:glycine cleavage system H lipoate-binding protein
MWVDPVSEDLCFIGLDGFAARAFGPIDRISFAVDAGTRPTAILNVNGVDFSMVFPSATTAVQQNSRLRAAPERLTAQPYIAGWLFQAASPPSGFAGLMQGAAAQRWISAEVERLSRAVHERCAPGADGGIFEPAILRHVDRETALVLFHEFFSPYATWTR